MSILSIPFSILKISLYNPKSAAMFFLGTPKRVRNNRGQRATQGLLYLEAGINASILIIKGRN